jgi:hypothetical protein
VLRSRYALGAVPFAHSSLLNASLEMQTSVLYVLNIRLMSKEDCN